LAKKLVNQCRLAMIDMSYNRNIAK